MSRRGGRGTSMDVDYTLPKVKVEVAVTDENTLLADARGFRRAKAALFTVRMFVLRRHLRYSDPDL